MLSYFKTNIFFLFPIFFLRCPISPYLSLYFALRSLYRLMSVCITRSVHFLVFFCWEQIFLITSYFLNTPCWVVSCGQPTGSPNVTVQKTHVLTFKIWMSCRVTTMQTRWVHFFLVVWSRLSTIKNSHITLPSMPFLLLVLPSTIIIIMFIFPFFIPYPLHPHSFVYFNFINLMNSLSPLLLLLTFVRFKRCKSSLLIHSPHLLRVTFLLFLLHKFITVGHSILSIIYFVSPIIATSPPSPLVDNLLHFQLHMCHCDYCSFVEYL